RAAGDPDAHVPGHPEAVVLLPSRHAPGLDERARVSRASDSSDHSFACRLSLWMGCPYPRLFIAGDRHTQRDGGAFPLSHGPDDRPGRCFTVCRPDLKEDRIGSLSGGTDAFEKWA